MATRSSMPGLSTFTATSRPSFNRASWTTAIEARPMGSGTISAKTSPIGIPRSASIVRLTSVKGTTGPVSRQERNSSASSFPNTPGAEATSWPNFT